MLMQTEIKIYYEINFIWLVRAVFL